MISVTISYDNKKERKKVNQIAKKLSGYKKIVISINEPEDW